MSQTLKCWDAVIVDDGSPDGTAEIAADFRRGDPRIRFVSKPNGGLSSARNYGMQFAEGKYWMFLDADDALSPDALGHLVGHAEQGQFELVYGGFLRFEHDPTLDWWGGRSPVVTSDLLLTLIAANHYPVHSAIILADYARQVGIFDESLTACEDWDYWSRAALRRARVGFVPHLLAYYRTSPGSMSSCSTRMLLNRIRVFLKTAEAYLSLEQTSVDVVQELFATASRLRDRCIAWHELPSRIDLVQQIESVRSRLAEGVSMSVKRRVDVWCAKHMPTLSVWGYRGLLRAVCTQRRNQLVSGFV